MVVVQVATVVVGKCIGERMSECASVCTCGKVSNRVPWPCEQACVGWLEANEIMRGNHRRAPTCPGPGIGTETCLSESGPPAFSSTIARIVRVCAVCLCVDAVRVACTSEHSPLLPFVEACSVYVSVTVREHGQ